MHSYLARVFVITNNDFIESSSILRRSTIKSEDSDFWCTELCLVVFIKSYNFVEPPSLSISNGIWPLRSLKIVIKMKGDNVKSCILCCFFPVSSSPVTVRIYSFYAKFPTNLSLKVLLSLFNWKTEKKKEGEHEKEGELCASSHPWMSIATMSDLSQSHVHRTPATSCMQVAGFMCLSSKLDQKLGSLDLNQTFRYCMRQREEWQLLRHTHPVLISKNTHLFTNSDRYACLPYMF